MLENEIQKILDRGEGITVEFKSAAELPKTLFDSVCAFLNRNGGTILLGINDDKQIVGVDPAKVEILCKEFASLSNNPAKIEPVFLLHPTVVEYQGKKLIHVFVPASSQVHKTGGKVFDRSVDGDFIVKADDQISNMYLRKNSFFSESTIYPFLNETHFDDGIIEKAKTIIRANRPNHPWVILSDADFFRAAGLYRTDITTGHEGFTLAALMLFGKKEIIQSTLPHYKIDALLRRNDLYRYDDRENIRCNLITDYEILMNFVAKHLPDKFYMEGDSRVSLREKIFREIIANFLIHREYTNAHPATFIIYADRVETRNANKPHLFGNLQPGNFEPFPKNPNIAKFFVQLARAEDLGTGIRNVFRYLKPYAGTVPVFREEDLFIVEAPLIAEVSVTSGGISGGINGGINGGISEDENTLLMLIKKNPGITINKLKEYFKVSRRTVEQWIALLRHQQKIEFRGSKKTGGYFPK